MLPTTYAPAIWHTIRTHLAEDKAVPKKRLRRSIHEGELLFQQRAGEVVEHPGPAAARAVEALVEGEEEHVAIVQLLKFWGGQHAGRFLEESGLGAQVCVTEGEARRLTDPAGITAPVDSSFVHGSCSYSCSCSGSGCVYD